MKSILDFLANACTILGINATDVSKKLRIFKNKKIRYPCIAFLCLLLIIGLYLHKQKSITITKVTLSEDSLTLNIDEMHSLIATVLYSDNSMSNDVFWNSTNNSIASVDQNGIVTALADGNTTIIAQAARNNSSEIAECTITVKTPPSGYSISVHQLAVDSYAYVYVKPYDTDITKVQIYGKSPSGEIFTPSKDENDLYRFYSECGTWTIYASVENGAGIYEAHKPEDFVTIEVTNISDLLDSSFEMFDNIFQQPTP